MFVTYFREHFLEDGELTVVEHSLEVLELSVLREMRVKININLIYIMGSWY